MAGAPGALAPQQCRWVAPLTLRDLPASWLALVARLLDVRDLGRLACCPLASLPHLPRVAGTPRSPAACRGNLPLLSALLKASPTSVGSPMPIAGRPARHRGGHEAAVQALLAGGADVNKAL